MCCWWVCWFRQRMTQKNCHKNVVRRKVLVLADRIWTLRCSCSSSEGLKQHYLRQCNAAVHAASASQALLHQPNALSGTASFAWQISANTGQNLEGFLLMAQLLLYNVRGTYIWCKRTGMSHAPGICAGLCANCDCYNTYQWVKEVQTAINNITLEQSRSGVTVWLCKTV